MIDDLTFLNDQWIWPVSFAAVILWLVFVWKEWSQFGSRKFIIKLILAFIAIAAVAMIALKPLSSISDKAYDAVLLTDNYDINQLDSLKKIHKRLTVFNYKANIPILNKSERPKSIFVLGNGVKPYDLRQLDSMATTYLGGSVPSGITRLKYETNNTVGNRAIFDGRYDNATKGHRLLLEGPGGTALDSVILSANRTQKFRLAADLTVAGNYLFSLIEKDTLGKIITKDPLPLVVVKQNRLKILIVNDFPTFETKYLKNFLAETGHQVLVRSQLTTGRYKFERFNMDSRPVVGYSQKQLESFDLMIMDATSLKNLSRRALNSLKQSVRENGLGIFIQPDSDFYNSSKRLLSFNFIAEKSAETTLEIWPRVKINKHLFRLKNEFQLQPIHQSDAKIYSAYKRLGEGRIGVTVFQNTYELLLNGDSKAYKYLWSRTIESLGKKEMPSVAWNANAMIGFQDMPFDFQLRTAIDRPIINTDEGYSIAMRRDMDITSLWKGRTYPRETGWKKHIVQQDPTEAFNYYVSDSTHWKSLMAFETIEANKRHFENNLQTENMSNTSMKPINSIWFFLIFALCIGYLWLEPKL